MKVKISNIQIEMSQDEMNNISDAIQLSLIEESKISQQSFNDYCENNKPKLEFIEIALNIIGKGGYINEINNKIKQNLGE